MKTVFQNSWLLLVLLLGGCVSDPAQTPPARTGREVVPSSSPAVLTKSYNIIPDRGVFFMRLEHNQTDFWYGDNDVRFEWRYSIVTQWTNPDSAGRTKEVGIMVEARVQEQFHQAYVRTEWRAAGYSRLISAIPEKAAVVVRGRRLQDGRNVIRTTHDYVVDRDYQGNARKGAGDVASKETSDIPDWALDGTPVISGTPYAKPGTVVVEDEHAPFLRLVLQHVAVDVSGITENEHGNIKLSPLAATDAGTVILGKAQYPTHLKYWFSTFAEKDTMSDDFWDIMGRNDLLNIK